MKTKYWILRVVFVLFGYFILSAEVCGQYSSPVRHKTLLGGTFGELRGTHFHAGIDFKPSKQGYEGDPIFSIQDGYVARIKTQRGGYGRAVYINHPNGQTSVYGHLSTLSRDIEKLLKAYQIEKESYEVDLHLTPDQLPVKKGYVMGTMGNAGRSFGSHLHFEIRDTKTDVALHPSDFGFKHIDTQAPTIVSLGIHGLLPDFHIRSYYSVHNFSKTDKQNVTEIRLPAWSCGISLSAFDTHNGAPNKNGYYQAKLFIDDTLYYHIKMDKISYYEGPLIKSFVDYPLRKKNNKTEALLFQLPSNQTLPIKYVHKNGVFQVSNSKVSRIRVEVSDHEGNTSYAHLHIKRSESINETQTQRIFDHYIKVEETHQKLNVNQLVFDIKPYSFARNQYFVAKMTTESPKCIKIGDKNEALLRSLDVCIPINKELISDKTVLTQRDGSTILAFTGSYKNGMWCTSISALGDYCFSTDTIAPTISVTTNLKKLVGVKNLSATLYDNMSHRRSFTYKVFIDNTFVPCVYRELNRRLTIPIGQLSTGAHTFSIQCTDDVGNKSAWRNDILIP